MKGRQCILLPFVLFSVAVCIGWVITPWFVRYNISQKFALSPEVNPELYSAWIHPPMPIYFKVYLFNVTNPETVAKGGLPKLAEVGPYVFRENRTKVDLVSDADRDTITYKEYISYSFDKNASGNFHLEDEFVILNAPFVAAAMKISHDIPWPLNEVGRMVLHQYQHVEPVFIRKTVDEILFKGWNVPFLEKMDAELGFSLLPNNSFSYFMNENDTLKGPYTVSRGVKDRATFGSVLKYKNSTEFDFWKKSSSCNKIEGTDGTLFPPFLTKATKLKFVNPNVCRSAYVHYEEESEVDGLHAFRFRAPPSIIADPRESEENRCFCVHVDDEPDKCLKQGALDLGPCREGAPVSMSPPHFVGAVPAYITNSGLIPHSQKHRAYMDVEPLTGVVLQGSNKLQINLNLTPVKGIKSLSKVPEMLFPLFWAEEYAKLDSSILQRLKTILYLLWFGEILSKWVIPLVVLIVSAMYSSIFHDLHSWKYTSWGKGYFQRHGRSLMLDDISAQRKEVERLTT